MSESLIDVLHHTNVVEVDGMFSNIINFNVNNKPECLTVDIHWEYTMRFSFYDLDNAIWNPQTDTWIIGHNGEHTIKCYSLSVIKPSQ